MKPQTLATVIVPGALFLAACAQQEVATPPPEVTAIEKYDPSKPDRLEQAVEVKVTGVVTHVDQKKRLVTLKGPEGNEETIEVGPEVKNLAQVKRGDMVIINVTEAASFRLLKPGEAKLGGTFSEAAFVARPGEKPAGAVEEEVHVVLKVKVVDQQKGLLTLEDADGNVATIRAQHPERLAPVKAGDLLAIDFSEAVSIVVEAPAKN